MLFSYVFTKQRGKATVSYPHRAWLSKIYGTPLEEHFLSIAKRPDLIQNTVQKPMSCSEQYPAVLNIEKIDSEFIHYCREARYRGMGNKQHVTVQEHMMRYDPYTIAMEIPIWNNIMSGFSDIWRWYNDKLQIFDFKPEAKKEKKAAIQLLWNRELAHHNTGLKRSRIECFYGDDTNCYQVIF